MVVMTKDDPFWDSDVVQAEAEAPSTGQYYSQTMELTINVKQDKMTLIEHIDCYRKIWAHLEETFNCKSYYVIEYCKSGQAHTHGFLAVQLHINTYNYSDKNIAEMVVKPIYKMLPKKYYLQFTKKHTWHNEYRRWKAPAVCLNIKNAIYKNWIDYCNKNACVQN